MDGSQLLRLVGGEWQIQPVLIDNTRNWGFGYIYAGDGALLVGCQFHAVLFDGTRWRKVFGYVDIDKWQQLQLLTQQHEDMGKLLESARALRDFIRSQP